MTEFAVLSFLNNLAYLVVALGVIRLALWYMNKSTGVKFSDVLKTINGSPVASALYYGARLIALCSLAAALVR